MIEFRKSPLRAAIAGLGWSVGSRVLTNADLEKMVDTSDQWITERTGIKERRLVRDDEATSDLATEAALKALEDAGLQGRDVDVIVVATVTPDMLFPCTANIVQKNIGAKKAAAFDVLAGCSGFIYALDIGSRFLTSGSSEVVLVIGADTLSKITNYKDRSTCILFGDGAGSCVLVPSSDGRGVLATVLGSDGSGADYLKLPAGGSRLPATEYTVHNDLHYIQMDGQKVFEFAVKILVDASISALDACGLTADDISMVIPHQANLRIVEAARRRLNIPPEKVMVNLDRYGNMSSASVIVALAEARDSGRIGPGDAVLLVAFGAGLTWASATVRL
ncbi:MAG TPA: ketoacyl-ACP synthase III [Clostridia bacterium]|nr:ketoacyl-ACP synthase III [Clostridia bacterium]